MRDRLSAQYLIALGARLMDEVGRMISRIGTKSRLATLGVDTEIRFTSAEHQAAFAHFRGEPVASITAGHLVRADQPLWPRFAAALGLSEKPATGEPDCHEWVRGSFAVPIGGGRREALSGIPGDGGFLQESAGGTEPGR